MEERKTWIDCAKGIGILLVVYGHVARGLYSAGIWKDANTFQLIDSIVYSFHMPLFFFLSGLFFSSAFDKRGAHDFIFSKIDTILYPYLLWSLMQGGLQMGMAGVANSDVGVANLVSILWVPIAQFWYLYALFVIFLIASLGKVWSSRFSIMLLAMGVVAYLGQNYLTHFFTLNKVADNLIFFAIGTVYLKALDANSFMEGRWFCAFSLVVFLLGQYIFHIGFALRYWNIGLGAMMLSLISVNAIISISLRLTKFNVNWLIFIGSSSMAIYLLHVIASASLRIVLQRILNYDFLLSHLFLGCAAGIALPLIADFVVRKMRIPFIYRASLSRPFRTATKAVP